MTRRLIAAGYAVAAAICALVVYLALELLHDRPVRERSTPRSDRLFVK
jgi:hypothetical protein